MIPSITIDTNALSSFAIKSLVQNISIVPEWGFMVSVTLPEINGTRSTKIFDPLFGQSFPALAFTTPSIATEVRQFSYTGLLKPYPLKKQHSEFSVSFILEDTFDSLSLFKQWHEYMFDGPKGIYVKSFEETLSGTVSVRMTGKGQKVTGGAGPIKVSGSTGKSKVFEFKNAFPTAILPMEFNQLSRNTFQTFTVTFAYEFYELKDN